MMIDSKILRDTFQRRRYGDTPGEYDPDIDLLDVAADEIERLTAENERMRKALEWYSRQVIDDDNRAYNALHPVQQSGSKG